MDALLTLPWWVWVPMALLGRSLGVLAVGLWIVALAKAGAWLERRLFGDDGS